MKIATLTALAVLATSSIVFAQSGDMKGMDMKGMDTKGMDMKGMETGKKPTAGTQVVHKATGVVKKVDPKSGIVTLAHDPVKSLNWSAMTMGFTVKDKTLLDKLPLDRKVEVEFVQQGKDYIITTVK
jgi:Cu(I)/Ag(I) efflux system protein CusF